MKKVLVLEDESSIRSFVVINLKRSGYEPIEAETGEQDLYGIINFGDPADVPALQRAVLPIEDDVQPPDATPIDAGAATDPIADGGPEEPAMSSFATRRRGHVEEVPSRAGQ